MLEHWHVQCILTAVYINAHIVWGCIIFTYNSAENPVNFFGDRLCEYVRAELSELSVIIWSELVCLFSIWFELITLDQRKQNNSSANFAHFEHGFWRIPQKISFNCISCDFFIFATIVSIPTIEFWSPTDQQ